MIEELELALEEQEPYKKGKHRMRRRKGRRGRTVVAMFVVLVIFGALGLGAYWGIDKIRDFFTAPDYPGGGVDSVQVQIRKGDSLADIGNTLQSKDVVKSAKAFVNAANDAPRARTIQPGTYKLRKQMRAQDAVNLLLDPASKLSNKVTVPEGKTASETLAILSEKTKIPVADFEALAKDPIKLGVPDFWFKRGDGKTATPSVEGFLFPDTYDFEPDATAEFMLKAMIGRFIEVATKLDLVNVAQQKSITPFDALIVASMVQAESGVKDDDAKIARVVYNRLKKDIVLEFDSTTNYGLMLRGNPRKDSSKLTQNELHDPNNSYSTHSPHKGMPPGPIGGAGEDALRAAINPAPGEWIFFVLGNKDGHSLFAVTDAEHEKNKRTACQNGIPVC